MQIDVYVSPGCASVDAVSNNIAAALAATGSSATVAFHEVSDQEARESGLKGSPTVLINGRDVAGGGAPGIG